MRPLTAAAGELTAHERERYARHTLLPGIGVTGQLRLKNARVLVVGAGGLGSPVLLYLAAAGIGTLGIVDDDDVDLSNLQRQVIHGVSDLGRSKLESARDRIAGLNPLVRVRLHETRLTAANALDLCRDYDLVVDGSDNFATRYLVSDAATLLDLPCVWGSISQFGGQVSVFHGPGAASYRDLYPEPPADGSVPSCADGGVFGMLCAVIGGMMVAEVVKLVTGTGRSLIGRVLIFDALDASWRELGLDRDLAAPAVTELVDGSLACETDAPGPAPGLPAARCVSAPELARLLADDSGDMDLIDVREPHEHAREHIPGSRNVPRDRIALDPARPDSSAVEPGLEQLSRDRDLVLYCEAGTRSTATLTTLLAQGYTRVRHLPGGIQDWTAASGNTEPALIHADASQKGHS